jgi:hypothetical protein
MRAPNAYLPPMKFLAGLLLTVLLAAFAAGPGVSGAAAAPHQDGPDQVMMMADCEDCPSEQMQAGADRCGSICVSPTIGLLGAQAFQPVSKPATSFLERGHALGGRTRRPELDPPRIS